MFTTSELDNYVNEAAHGYLKESKPLNETITKIASEHGLNRDQIARVVEGANTEVYVQMMNQTQDKYIQFDNASAEKVAGVVFGTEKSAEYSIEDYEEEPPIEIADSNFEKLASIEEIHPDETETVKQAYRLAALDERLTNSLYEIDVRFQGHADGLYGVVKQAYLGGTSFGDLQRAMNLTFDSPVVKKVMDECQEKLATEIYPIQLNTSQEYVGSVNMSNPMIKQAELIVKDTQEFITLREKLAEAHKEMEKLAAGMPQVKAYFKTVGKALGGQNVHVFTNPKAAASATAVAASSKAMSGVKKTLLAGGAGVIGGMGFQAHMQNVRRQQTVLPMPPGAGRFRT